MDKLSRTFGVAEPLGAAIRDGLPAYGTCAGMIMLSSRIAAGIPGQQTLDVLDTTVRRNAFGNQNDSFETDIPMPALGEAPVHACVHPRARGRGAPGPASMCSAPWPTGRSSRCSRGNVLASAFHPDRRPRTASTAASSTSSAAPAPARGWSRGPRTVAAAIRASSGR